MRATVSLIPSAGNRLKTVLAAYELERRFVRQVSLPVADRLRLGLSREQPAAGAYRRFRSENKRLLA